MTITEIYRLLNEQKRIDESHRLYLQLVRFGKGEEYVGADLMRDWYSRNLKIFSNVMRLTNSKDDRILVLIGSGHVKMLQQFAADSGEYSLEKTTKYF